MNSRAPLSPLSFAPPARTSSDVFAQFPPSVAEGLRRIATVRSWDDGETVVQGGVIPRSVLLIQSGRLRFAGTSREGDEVLFRWFVPGEFVALASVLGNFPFAVDAIAVGRCEAMYFERSQLLDFLRSDAEAALLMAGLISLRANELTHLVIALAGRSLISRVYSTLRRLALHSGVRDRDGGTVLTASQQDIASAVGASRQRVNIELRRLEVMGRIQLGYGHIVVTDPLDEDLPETR